MRREKMKDKFSKKDKKLLKNIELAGKIVLKEDVKLFKELGKKQAKPIILDSQEFSVKKDGGSLSKNRLGITRSRTEQGNKICERSSPEPADSQHTPDKINIYEPVSIEDAINCLQTFLECDLWHLFKDEKIKDEIFTSEDKFKKEEDLWKYLDRHFDILMKEINKFKEQMKDKLENAQEDYGNLDWISKEQAIKIIDKTFLGEKK